MSSTGSETTIDEGKTTGWDPVPATEKVYRKRSWFNIPPVALTPFLDVKKVLSLLFFTKLKTFVCVFMKWNEMQQPV